MRIALFSAVFLLACIDEAPVAPPDAGPVDAGCPEGKVPGPLGSCIDESIDCDTCVSDADCSGGEVCGVLSGGCHACQNALLRCSTTTCQGGADCCNGLTCRTADEPPSCGMCRDVDDECGADLDDCGAGRLCLLRPPPSCSCSGAPVRVCVDRCADATGCEADERCLPSGECEAIACEDGYTCATFADCVAGGDRHGCQPRPCTTNTGCPGGVCVSGSCHAEAGSCAPMAP